MLDPWLQVMVKDGGVNSAKISSGNIVGRGGALQLAEGALQGLGSQSMLREMGGGRCSGGIKRFFVRHGVRFYSVALTNMSFGVEGSLSPDCGEGGRGHCSHIVFDVLTQCSDRSCGTRLLGFVAVECRSSESDLLTPSHDDENVPYQRSSSSGRVRTK